jgi:choline dehydrogenase
MGVNQAGGFVAAQPGSAQPALQLYFNPASYSTRGEDRPRRMNPDPFPGFSMSAHGCRPTSRGFVAIASGDPMEPPRIVPRYLSTEHDVAQALAAARLLRKLAVTRPLCDAVAAELLPGDGCRGDDALLQDFRARADTIFHPVGTCAMGPDAATSVVDSRLRVHGVAGLRVIDASVFPSITSGNTNAPTVMVAEKGAQMVLKDIGRA